MLSGAGAHREHPQPRTEGQSGALRSYSLSLQYYSELLQLVHSKVGLLQYNYQDVWEPELAAPVCVFAGGIDAVAMWIFMSCYRNWGEEALRNTKVQLLPFISVLFVFFCVFLSTFALIKQGNFTVFTVTKKLSLRLSLGQPSPGVGTHGCHRWELTMFPCRFPDSALAHLRDVGGF